MASGAGSPIFIGTVGCRMIIYWRCNGDTMGMQWGYHGDIMEIYSGYKYNGDNKSSFIGIQSGAEVTENFLNVGKSLAEKSRRPGHSGVTGIHQNTGAFI